MLLCGLLNWLCSSSRKCNRPSVLASHKGGKHASLKGGRHLVPASNKCNRLSVLEDARPSAPASQLYVFIDDSNLWIGGQDGNRSFRVDLIELWHLLSDGHLVSEAILYGSCLAGDSTSDSYWDFAQRNGYKVKRFKRSHAEKEVDVSLACDIVEMLYTICTENVIVVIVTGDRDMKPAVMKCLEKNVSVELWSFKVCFSEYYDSLEREYGLFSVKPLDGHRDRITYVRDKKND